MKVIILGAGQVGTTLATSLCAEHDITVVDIDTEALRLLQSKLDIRTVVGSGSYPHILEDAGANDADMLIAVTNSDECNIVSCQIAYSLFKTPTKIARVRYKELTKYPELFQADHIPIDMIINPAELVTQRIKRQIEYPGTQTVLDFAEDKIQIASVSATPPCKIIGKKVLELYQDIADKDVQAKIIAITRNANTFIPDTETFIEPHDTVYFCAKKENLKACTQALLQAEEKFRRIFIAGGGNIGINLAQALEDDYKVKLVDGNAKQCEHAAEVLHNTVVLNGDAVDTDLLQSESIDETDLFISVTNDDEANMMSAILAKRLGAHRTFALVNRQTYAHFLIERSPDIDMAISPQKITGSQIIKHLHKGDMVNVYQLPRSGATALEIIAHGDEKTSAVIGKPLANIKLSSDVHICAVRREDEIILAHEEMMIQDGDHVILFLADQSLLREVEKRFQVEPSFL